MRTRIEKVAKTEGDEFVLAEKGEGE